MTSIHTIRCQLVRLSSTAGNLLLAGLFVMIGASTARATVVINEFMYHPATDDDGQEFLELYNTGPSSVNLQNWCIDGIAFCFGAGASIPSHGFLVLAKDAAKFQARYGFAPAFVYTGQLSNSGELLTLSDASQQVVDQVEYDHVGEWPTKPDGLGPSLERIDPTLGGNTPRNWRACTFGSNHSANAPNSVNAVGLPPWITEVQHTQNVQASQPITVSARVLDATSIQLTYKIGFTADVNVAMFDDGAHGDGGASDGVFGYVIPGQPASTMVRYRITATGPTGTMRYPRTDDTLNYAGTMVADPTLSQVPIFQWFMDPIDYQHSLDHRFTDQTEPAVFFYNGLLYDNVQVRIRGQTARSWDKPNWKFKFPQGHDFFATGLTPVAVDNFDLQSHYSDKAFCREILSTETLRDCGVPSSFARHVRVQQNGQFFGLFTYMEDHGDEWVTRMGLDPDGARYKSFDTLVNRGSEAALHSWYEKDSRTNEDYTDLYNLIVVLNSGDYLSRRNYLFDNLNIPEIVSYLAANILFHNNDHPAKNYTMYRDTLGTQRWLIFPWDLDLTFGRNYGAGGGVLSDGIWADVDSISGLPNVSPSHPLFGDQLHQKYDQLWNRGINAVLADPKIREMYFRRLRTVMDQILAGNHYENRIDALLALVGPEVDLDHAKWPQYGATQTLSQAVSLLKNSYLIPRRTHLFTTHRVTGEIPPAQSPAPLIVINEIMYHPVGDDTLGEFVELYNPSSTESVDVSYWRLDGVALTLPAGVVILPNDFVVVVRNDVGFRGIYGSGKFIGAQYSGELHNQGESIVLRDQNGRIVDEVFYEDRAPWPTSADAGGMSLERIDPSKPGSWPANWAASLAVNGTPAAPNSRAGILSSLPGLHINEVLPVNTSVNRDDHNEFAPWIELYNSSSETISLNGLYLTDNYAQPTKWPFASGTQLCAGQWLLIWADNQPAQGPLHTNFALNAAGGSVGLYDSTSTLIDYLNYPALAANRSYGSFPDATLNRVQFPVPTPSAANVAATTPVILNEYNAVSPTGFIKNGASDSYFGRILGNGGDWFELAVTRNHVDMRGWQLVAIDNPGPSQTIQTLTLTNQAIWSDLRAGTIITVCESVPDDVSYNPLAGDWWINVRAGTSGTGTYISATDFEVDQRNWQLTIKNAQGQVMFGPAGEGVQPATGIGNDEVFKLEEDPSEFTTPLSNYNDGSSSTFGSPNLFNSGTQSQDFGPLRSQVFACNNDGECADDDPCTIDDCVNGECYHTSASVCYRLSLDVVGSTQQCPGAMDVQLNLAGLITPINGVQVLLRYDPARMTLQNITPGGGSSPWNAAMPISFNDTAGAVTYALALFGGSTTTDATVATLHFNVLNPGADLSTTQVIFQVPASCSPLRTKLTTSLNETLYPTTVDSSQITVGPRLTVDLHIQGLNHAVTRDVTFVLTDCANQGSPQTIHKLVAFNASGNGSVVLTGVDPAADYLAVVEGHTLRRRLQLSWSTCFATASFTSASELISGDLQTSAIAQDNLVDILDFAILAARFGTMCTDCVTGLPQDCSLGADINGDGMQETADFTSIQINFFKQGDEVNGCPAILLSPKGKRDIPSGAPPIPTDASSGKLARASIDISSLPPSLSSSGVDLNGDGLVDVQDVRLFARRSGLPILPEFEQRVAELAEPTTAAPAESLRKDASP